MWADDRMSYFSKDSKYYFFALYDTDQLQIISLESRRGTITYCSLGDRLKETAVSLNPLYFCTVTPKQCLLWNQNTKKVDKKIENTLDFICCCFKNNDKELVTLSYQEQDATLISCWCLKKLKVLSQWTCKYISHSAKCYVIEETQILIIDYQDVHEHYFQIWNILGQSLIRILYEAIDSFYILNNFGSKLIVDCEDDEDDDNDENADKSDEYKWISIFDILTFKYQRFKTFIEQGQSFYVQEGALIIQNRKNNSEDVGIFINIK
ncbi:unnamed protein product (macronuclear) [Paramecium tetraurelia]|uniref:Uncharacterized protein n=1 Tax=Paramecium tetraurelia TaxID=5888 RepID=A0CB18_PARTE|nr:uncharacterized protein GSPATT00036768001 [Paramecium tetraurelia]CAK67985.1 unnamed protein product [Paramecium tetraurelia]|eukprot:XP_001435382.1 hypothetical protein (macronuclear) [Paramecium tetraurelia strain d4-2]